MTLDEIIQSEEYQGYSNTDKIAVAKGYYKSLLETEEGRALSKEDARDVWNGVFRAIEPTFKFASTMEVAKGAAGGIAGKMVEAGGRTMQAARELGETAGEAFVEKGLGITLTPEQKEASKSEAKAITQGGLVKTITGIPLEDVLTKGGQAITEATMPEREMSYRQQLVKGAAETVGTNLAYLGIGALTGGGAFVPLSLMSTQAGALKYGELRDQGYSIGLSAMVGLGYGASEAATEYLPVTRALGLVHMGIATRLAKTGLYELPTEAINEMAQIGIDYMATHPNMSRDEMTSRLKDTFWMTLISIPFLGGGAYGLSKMVSSIEQAKAKIDMSAADKITVNKAHSDIAKTGKISGETYEQMSSMLKRFSTKEIDAFNTAIAENVTTFNKKQAGELPKQEAQVEPKQMKLPMEVAAEGRGAEQAVITEKQTAITERPVVAEKATVNELQNVIDRYNKGEIEYDELEKSFETGMKNKYKSAMEVPDKGRIETGINPEEVGVEHGIKPEWAKELPKTLTTYKGLSPEGNTFLEGDFGAAYGGDSSHTNRTIASQYAKQGHIVTRNITPKKMITVQSPLFQSITERIGYPENPVLNLPTQEQRMQLEAEMAKEGVDTLIDLKTGEVTSYKARPEFEMAEANHYKGNKLYLQPGEDAYIVFKGNKEVAMVKMRDGIPVDEGTGEPKALAYLHERLGIQQNVVEQPESKVEAETAVETEPEAEVVAKPTIKDVQKAAHEMFEVEAEPKTELKIGDIIEPITKPMKLIPEQLIEAKAYAKQKGYKNLTEEGLVNVYKQMLEDKVKPVDVDKDIDVDEALQKDIDDSSKNSLLDEGGYVDVSKLFGRPLKVPAIVAKNIYALKKKFDLMKIPPEVTNASTEAESLQAEKFAANFIRFGGEILSQDSVMIHPKARAFWEESANYTETKQVLTYKMVDQEVNKFLKETPAGITRDMWMFLQGIVEPPISARPYVEEARRIQDSYRKLAQKFGYDVGYLKDYLPRYFDKYRVMVKGFDHSKFYDTFDEAIAAAKKLEANGAEVLSVGPTLTPDAADVFISSKGLVKFVKKLQQDLTGDWSEIKTLLSEAGIKQRPRSIFNTNFTKRVTDNPYYHKNYPDVLRLYAHKIIRKITADSYMNSTEKILSDIKSPELREVLMSYRETVLGYPGWVDKALASVASGLTGKEINPTQAKQAMYNIAAVQYVSDLGGMVSSALTNSFQILATTAPVLGFGNTIVSANRTVNVLQQMARGKSSVIAHEIIREGIIEEASIYAEGKLAKGLAIPLKMFTTVEQFDRVTTYIAAKNFVNSQGIIRANKALDLLGTPPSASVRGITNQSEYAIEFAKEVVNRTQFRAEAFNSPGLLNKPIVSIVAPYMKFMVNYHTFMFRLLRGSLKLDKEAIKALSKFIGVSLLLGGHKANILSDTFFGGINTAYKAIFNQDLRDIKLGVDDKDDWKVGEVFELGLPGMIGLDMTTAVQVENPFASNMYTKDKGLIERRMGGIAPRMAKGAYALATGNNEEAYKFMVPRLIKKIHQSYEVVASGRYTDNHGRLMAENIPKSQAVKNVLGFVPPKVMDEYRRKEVDFEVKEWYNKNVVRPIKTTWADKIQQDKEDQAEIVIDDLVDMVEQLEKQYEKAKPGRLQDELGKKLQMSADALRSGNLFREAIKERSIESVYRERRKVFKQYGVKNLPEEED